MRSQKYYKQLEYIRYKQAKSNISFDAYHGTPPKGEYKINEITEKIAKQAKTSSIISTISRTKADLNREITEESKDAIIEYQQTLKKITIKNNIQKYPYLLIILHGMKNRENKDIEIGTRNGELTNPKLKQWFIKQMQTLFSDFKIAIDEEFKGTTILEEYKNGNNYFEGLGNNLNIFQIELSIELREKHTKLIIDNFSQIALNFSKEF